MCLSRQNNVPFLFLVLLNDPARARAGTSQSGVQRSNKKPNMYRISSAFYLDEEEPRLNLIAKATSIPVFCIKKLLRVKKEGTEYCGRYFDWKKAMNLSGFF